jgi:hypothetical protein
VGWEIKIVNKVQRKIPGDGRDEMNKDHNYIMRGGS